MTSFRPKELGLEPELELIHSHVQIPSNLLFPVHGMMRHGCSSVFNLVIGRGGQACLKTLQVAPQTIVAPTCWAQQSFSWAVLLPPKDPLFWWKQSLSSPFPLLFSISPFGLGSSKFNVFSRVKKEKKKSLLLEKNTLKHEKNMLKYRSETENGKQICLIITN